MKALATALKSARQIAAWCASHLADDAPALHALLELLKPFEQPESRMTAVTPEVPTLSDRSNRWTARHPACALPSQVRDNIRAARDWFEAHEPSSPVAILLGQAERMVGRRFSEVADAIPLDLLRKWDAQGEPT
jgi:type VI secretion system protein ImpA